MSDPGFGRSLRWAAAVPASLLFFPLFIPVLLGRVFAHTDIGVFHLPLRVLYASALTQGQSIVWTSRLFGGFYVHAEGQIGALHPLHLILYSLLPVTIALNLELIFAYAFAFAGMWLFLRRLGLHAASCTVGAMAFAFSGFCLLHLGHPNAVAVTSHIPWLLLTLEVSMTASGRQRGLSTAAIAALTGSQVLLGYPQYGWISTVIYVVYAILRGIDRTSRLWLPALASIAGLMIGGAQLLPTLDLLSQSERISADREFQLSFSLHPLNLMQLWSPYALPSRVYAAAHELYVHEFGVYNGALGTLAAVWALLRRRRLSCGLAAAFAGILCVLGLVLALGKHGFVYEYLAALPIVGAFRAPARHLVLLHVGLAVLVAVMFDDLVRLAREPRSASPPSRWMALPLGMAAVTAVAALVWWVSTGSAPKDPTYFAAVLTGLGLMAVGTTLVRDAARRVPAALLVIPTFLALDLGFWGYSYAWGSAPLTVEQIAAMATGPAAATPMSVHDETGDPTVNYWLLRNARVLRPYVGLIPRFKLTPTEQTLRLAGVDWVNTSSGWRQVPDPMPRARIVPAAQVSRDPSADLRAIDIAQTALVEREVPDALAAPDRVNVRLVADVPGRLEFDVACPQAALLSITETFHDGWTARRNGELLRTLPLYGDFLGVVLEEGTYRLTLTFEPRSLRYGGYLTLAGILATALLAVFASSRPDGSQHRP